MPTFDLIKNYPMNLRINFFFVFVLFFVNFSCKSEIKNAEIPTSVSVSEVPNSLSPMGEDVFLKMYNECTFIDYIWHDLPFSVSQSEKAAVQANVSFIGKLGMETTPAHCKSIGRKSYQINGDIFMDADIYFGPGCSYYIFLKDEKPIYLNQMTPQGDDFYRRLFESAMQQGQKIYEGQPQ